MTAPEPGKPRKSDNYLEHLLTITVIGIPVLTWVVIGYWLPDDEWYSSASVMVLALPILFVVMMSSFILRTILESLLELMLLWVQYNVQIGFYLVVDLLEFTVTQVGLGDLLEEYSQKFDEDGVIEAVIWFVYQVVASTRPLALQAFRNLLRGVPRNRGT
jgi:hypothetical protein